MFQETGKGSDAVIRIYNTFSQQLQDLELVEYLRTRVDQRYHSSQASYDCRPRFPPAFPPASRWPPATSSKSGHPLLASAPYYMTEMVINISLLEAMLICIPPIYTGNQVLTRSIQSQANLKLLRSIYRRGDDR